MNGSSEMALNKTLIKLFDEYNYSKYTQFVKEKTITYDVLLDQQFSATKEYGVLTLPTIFIIDKMELSGKKYSVRLNFNI